MEWQYYGLIMGTLGAVPNNLIGSGRIESACKLVVQQRCKGPGMRWGHPQADAVLQHDVPQLAPCSQS
jgi:hypothetical protein